MSGVVTVTQADQVLVAQIGDALEYRDFDRADSLAARHRLAAEAASKVREAELVEALETLEAALVRDMGAGYAGVALCQAARAKATSDA